MADLNYKPTKSTRPSALRHNPILWACATACRCRATPTFACGRACDQTTFEPGATVTVRTMLTEYDAPLAARAEVLARIEVPTCGPLMLSMPEILPGIFEGVMATAQAGLYGIQVGARGKSRRGLPCTREQALTAAVFRGGDSPPPRSEPQDQGREDLCRLANCLLDQEGIRPLLQGLGVETRALKNCLDAYCRPAGRGARGETGRSRAAPHLDVAANSAPGHAPRRLRRCGRCRAAEDSSFGALRRQGGKT